VNKVVQELVKIAKELVADEAAGLPAALQDFMKWSQEMLDKYMKDQFPTLPVDKLVSQEGHRFVKIIKVGNQRVVWAFIDKMNGDILKPASWNAPAKHARGNVFDKNTWQSVGPHGPAYLR